MAMRAKMQAEAADARRAVAGDSEAALAPDPVTAARARLQRAGAQAMPGAVAEGGEGAERRGRGRPRGSVKAAAPAVAEPSAPVAGGAEQHDGLRPRRRPAADRKPFGAADQQLFWPPIPGMRLYWFNDTPGRVGRAKAAGYEHVIGENGEPVHRNVGRGDNGKGGMDAYLMQILEEWYLMDKKEADDALEARLTDIRRGRTQNENQYVDAARHRVEMSSPR